MPKKNQKPRALGVIYDRIFACKIGVQTGGSKNLRALIGLAPKSKQMRWLVKNKIPPCFWN